MSFTEAIADGGAAPSRDADAPFAESSIQLLSLDFDSRSPAEVLRLIAARPAGAPFAYVVTPNADHLVRLSRDPATYRQLYDGAWLCLLDSRVVRRGPPARPSSAAGGHRQRSHSSFGPRRRDNRRVGDNPWADPGRSAGVGCAHQTLLYAPRPADRLREPPGFLRAGSALRRGQSSPSGLPGGRITAAGNGSQSPGGAGDRRRDRPVRRGIAGVPGGG